MGIKALVYFEIVTTLALFIGLAAIQSFAAPVWGSRRRPMLPRPRFPARRRKNGLTLSCTSFRKIIAKSVAEGQVLQVVVFSIIFGIALALDRRRKTPSHAGFLRKPF